LVEDGLRSSDPIRRNSCEWIKREKTGIVPLYALTETHDSAERVGAQGGDPAQLTAFFGYNLEKYGVFGKPLYYAGFDPYDLTNIVVHPNQSEGFRASMDAGIGIVDAARRISSENLLIDGVQWLGVPETIKHEVQHAADPDLLVAIRSKISMKISEIDDEEKRKAVKLAEEAFVEFKTEWRAHLRQGCFRNRKSRNRMRRTSRG
jgi:hypothetical protein